MQRFQYSRQDIYKKLKVPNSVQKLLDSYLTNERILYLFFGVMTTLIDIVVYWVATNVFGIGYRIATIVAWIIAITFAFVTNKFFVFKSKSVSTLALIKVAVSFVLSRLITGLINYGWMVFAVEIANIDDFIAKIVSNVFVVIANYIFSKLFVFRKSKRSE